MVIKAVKELILQVPLPIVMALASPYLGGKTAQEAIDTARLEFEKHGLTANIDVLGEDSTNIDQCEATVEHYKTLIDLLVKNQLNTKDERRQMTISLKPSMFSEVTPQADNSSKKALDAAFDRIARVVDYAFHRSIGLTIDAEDHRWITFHLESYFALINAGYTNLGTVMQSRLFRTEKDLTRFDDRMRVRLVIGIYNEPANIAITQKSLMKKALIRQAQTLARRGTYVELATHDKKCLDEFFTQVVLPDKLSPDRFETQFLYGVPREALEINLASGEYFRKFEKSEIVDRLIAEGVIVRLYLPFGTKEVAGPYCRRRIHENPNIISFGIKNLLHIH